MRCSCLSETALECVSEKTDDQWRQPRKELGKTQAKNIFEVMYEVLYLGSDCRNSSQKSDFKRVFDKFQVLPEEKRVREGLKSSRMT